MATKTVFCVLAFAGSQWRLSDGQLRQFGSEDQALAHAEALKARGISCTAMRMQGDPEADCWDEPAVLMEFGDVPKGAA